MIKIHRTVLHPILRAPSNLNKYIFAIRAIFFSLEFSQNFNVEILENLESVKTTPETNYKIFLMINIQGFCYKEILNIF